MSLLLFIKEGKNMDSTLPLQESEVSKHMTIHFFKKRPLCHHIDLFICAFTGIVVITLNIISNPLQP